MKDINSLSHTKWNCKYHIVFAPKYRRKEFYGANRLEIGKILRELCKWKDVNIIPVNVKYHDEYCKKIYDLLLNEDIRVEYDNSKENMGKKIIL